MSHTEKLIDKAYVSLQGLLMEELFITSDVPCYEISHILERKKGRKLDLVLIVQKVLLLVIVSPHLISEPLEEINILCLTRSGHARKSKEEFLIILWMTV